MTVTHFYHVWPRGTWQDIVGEHKESLDEGGFSGKRFACLGQGASLSPHLDFIKDQGFEFMGKQPSHSQQWVQSEAWTLHYLWEHVQDHDEDILYAHTKGTHSDTPFNHAWRRAMTKYVVEDWGLMYSLMNGLNDDLGTDVAGVCWIPRQAEWSPGFFAGNFWLATASYLRTLPDPLHQQSNRFEAERWIGLGEPKVYEHGLKGRPTSELFKDFFEGPRQSPTSS